MINILLVCSAGMSTSFLVEKMKKSATEKGIDVTITASPEASAKDFLDNTDVLLLGPQVKYLEAQMKELFNNVPVGVINMVDYGMMNGPKVLDYALELINNK